MKTRLLPTAAAFALCALALSFAANAQKVINPDQAKNVTPATAKLPASTAKFAAHLVLKPVIEYIGGNYDIGDQIYAANAWAVACQIEVQVAGYNQWVVQPKSIPNYNDPNGYLTLPDPNENKIPESQQLGTFPLKARIGPYQKCPESDWATTTLAFVKGPTYLKVGLNTPVALPPALAPVAAISEETEVLIWLVDSTGYPLEKRSVVVTGGAVDGQVPPSNKDGRITFRVLHSKLNPSQVQIAFMGDSAYQPSSLSVTVP